MLLMKLHIKYKDVFPKRLWNVSLAYPSERLKGIGSEFPSFQYYNQYLQRSAVAELYLIPLYQFSRAAGRSAINWMV